MFNWFKTTGPTRYGVDTIDSMTAPQARTLADRIISDKEIGFTMDSRGFVYLRNPSPLHPIDGVVGGVVNYSPLAQIRGTTFHTRFEILNTELKCLKRYHDALRVIYHASF